MERHLPPPSREADRGAIFAFTGKERLLKQRIPCRLCAGRRRSLSAPSPPQSFADTMAPGPSSAASAAARISQAIQAHDACATSIQSPPPAPVVRHLTSGAPGPWRNRPRFSQQASEGKTPQLRVVLERPARASPSAQPTNHRPKANDALRRQADQVDAFGACRRIRGPSGCHPNRKQRVASSCKPS